MGQASDRLAIVIAGPTASGKSALALELARRHGGTVINADAMQCYADLRVLTARPGEADEAAAPHRLYGVRAADEPANAAWWRMAALAELKAAKLPILCGGTGMYFSALFKGIAELPEIGEAARREARGFLADMGPAKLHEKLAAVDPETAAKLKPGDSQRVARAWEVFAGTGQGLAWWQSRPAAPLTGWRTKFLLLDPPREDLRVAIEARFEKMLAAGAVEEVRRLAAKNLDPALPVMRAHGVPEVLAYLRGEIGLDEAARRAILATYQYTKRQNTWFRHQKLVGDADMHIIHPRIASWTQDLEYLPDHFDNFIKLSG